MPQEAAYFNGEALYLNSVIKFGNEVDNNCGTQSTRPKTSSYLSQFDNDL